MVGQVVNKGYQAHVGAKVLTSSNSTVAELLSTNTTASPNPQIEPLVQSEGYANPIKLGHALSVTFVVGCVQVSAIFCVRRLAPHYQQENRSLMCTCHHGLYSIGQ